MGKKHRMRIDPSDEIVMTARALARRSQGRLFRCVTKNKKPRRYVCEVGVYYAIPAWKLAALERRGFLVARKNRAVSFRVIFPWSALR